MRIFSRKADQVRGVGSTRPARQQQPRAAQCVTSSTLDSDIVVSGNIEAAADLRIDGHVLGDVSCRTLIQGARSRIVGRVTAEIARLAGSIEGVVRVRQLTIESSAEINADVEYEKLAIERGSNVNGWLSCTRPTPSDLPQSGQ
jgi:cytoskeletal protein CcmA (bactofilin family)